jgi:allantoicase
VRRGGRREVVDAVERLRLERRLLHELLPHSPLQPHTRHRWFAEVTPRSCTHVRLNIYPDGGVARLRLFGRAVSE